MSNNEKTPPQDQSKNKAAEHKPANKPEQNPAKTGTQSK